MLTVMTEEAASRVRRIMPEQRVDTTPLRIWQQNTNKSLIAQLDVLHTATPADYDLIFIQEPHIDFNKLTRALSHWHVIYPTGHHDRAERTRSVTLVSKRLTTNNWTHIDIDSPDITGLSIVVNNGTFHMFNIYLDGEDNSPLTILARTCRRLRRGAVHDGSESTHHIFWAGDFNRHHPMWDEERNHHLFTPTNLDRAQPLLNIIAAFDMHMLLEEGTPTLEATRSKNLTRPDNVFATEGIGNRLISCVVLPERRPPYTDHFPVSTTIDITVTERVDSPRRNFCMVNWEEFRDTLRNNIRSQDSPDKIRHSRDFTAVLDNVMTALRTAIDEHVPTSTPSPFCKRWWTKDLAKERTNVQKLARKAYKLRNSPDHPIHAQWRKARNAYGVNIQKSKQEHWEVFLEDADERSIWTVSRFVRADPTDGGSTRVPPLRRSPDSTSERLQRNEDKSKVLYETFFPPPSGDSEVQEETVYPPPKFRIDTIEDSQIQAAIDKLKPYKVPGPDGIPNVMYKECSKILVPMS